MDLLKVQTQMLGRYHVTDPDLFLDGSRNWVVSADPGSAPEGTSSTPGGIPPVPQVLDTATSEGPRWMTVRPFNLGSAANASSPRAALSAFALADNDDAELLELWTVPNPNGSDPVSYTHLRAHETVLDLVCRLLLEKKKHTRPIYHSHSHS